MENTKTREYVYPKRRHQRYDLPEVVVTSKCSANIVSKLLGPGCHFRPEGFLIPDDAAEHLLITDVKVGKNSQFYGTGAIPAGLFAESAPEAMMRMEPLGPNMSIVLSLINVSDHDVTFRGQVRGETTHENDELLGRCDSIILGLGSYQVAGRGKATINVESIVELTPYRLYVPPSTTLEIESLASKSYLNTESASRVPAAQLSRENLASGGLVRLDPEPTVLAQTYISITVVNRAEKPESFCGAILATLS
jgi:hypothetical protein